MTDARYVLVTAARNEQQHIAATIESVLSQSVRPLSWAIVSDASTDNTDDIVAEYARQHTFIRLIRLTADHPRNFAAQANAINTGWRALDDCKYDFIGNLDADVTFPPDYFADLLAHFAADPRLGLAGGRIEESDHDAYIQTDLTSVPHTTQFFRRECFEQVGGYVPLEFGGSDTCAGVLARMNGWQVALIPDLIVRHHRPSSSSGGLLKGKIREGRMDFSLGYLPVFEVGRCLRRVQIPPILIGSLFRLAGFFAGYLTFTKPLVSREYIRFSRKEQLQTLLTSISPARFLQLLQPTVRPRAGHTPSVSSGDSQ